MASPQNFSEALVKRSHGTENDITIWLHLPKGLLSLHVQYDPDWTYSPELDSLESLIIMTQKQPGATDTKASRRQQKHEKGLTEQIHNSIQQLKLINCAGMNDSLQLQKERKTDSSLLTDAARVQLLSLFEALKGHKTSLHNKFNL